MLRPSAKYGSPQVEAIGAHDRSELALGVMSVARRQGATAVPGWGVVGMGIVALGSAWFAQEQRQPEAWVMSWLIGAVVASHLGIVAAWNKARRLGVALLGRSWRGKVLGSGVAFLVGSMLTVALLRRDAFGLLPGAWLLLYGLAILAGGAWSVRIVPALGAGFTGLGVLALVAPNLGHVFMVAGFGVWQIACGIVIARKHGG